MTPAQLLNSFRLIADDTVPKYLWQDDEVFVYAAEGELEAARRARLIRDRATADVCVYSVTAGDQKITLDPRVIFVRNLHIASQMLPLIRTRTAMMDLAFPQWDSTLNLGEVLRFIPDKQTGEIWFDAPFPTDDTVTLTAIREPLQAITNGNPVAASASLTNGGLGDLIVTAGVPGTAANALTLQYVGATGAGHLNRALSLSFYTDGSPIVTLGTDGAGTLDATQNTFALVAALINANGLGFFTALNTSDNDDYVQATGTVAFTGGAAAGATVSPEIAPRYHHGIVQWMLWRAFGKQDAQTNDPDRAAKALASFEAEFGKKSSALDETYINEQQLYDEYDGAF
jgi:hypothetical protein